MRLFDPRSSRYDGSKLTATERSHPFLSCRARRLYATTLIVAGATQRFGTDEQKREILGGIAGGAVEAIAMTEPESGSDVGSLTCTAERVDGGFVLNGQKVFISNAHISDHVLVVCRTTKTESKHEGLTMIWVPSDVDGMEIVPIETMGGRETNSLYFSDCAAPAEAVLGEVDQGWTQLMAGLNVERARALVWGDLGPSHPMPG